MDQIMSQRLAARRANEGLSQEALANKLGVSRQAVSKWERGEASPDTDNLIALARLYGITIDELLYVDESDEEAQVQESPSHDAAKPEFCTENEVKGCGAESTAHSQKESISDSEEKDSSESADSRHTQADYVHVSPFDGVHVVDGKKGNEVHVGWDGIYVEDPGKDEHVRIDWTGIHARSRDGHSVDGRWRDKDAPVVVDGETYASWQDAHRAFHRTCCSPADKAGCPLMLIALVAYLLFGIIGGAWVAALPLLFIAPAYYAVERSVKAKSIMPFFEIGYPTACIGWFLYMTIILGQPHPAWLIFLTIPLFEGAVHACRTWWRRRG